MPGPNEGAGAGFVKKVVQLLPSHSQVSELNRTVRPRAESYAIAANVRPAGDCAGACWPQLSTVVSPRATSGKPPAKAEEMRASRARTMRVRVMRTSGGELRPAGVFAVRG